MAHDVFISYPSNNKPVADATCAKLEANNLRCWIAPRDILPGQPYSKAIFEAIDTSKIFILIFSAETNSSPHILSEVREAFNKNLIIIPFRLDDILPSKELDYYIGSPHWLDAMTPPLENHIDELVRIVQVNLEVKSSSSSTIPRSIETPVQPQSPVAKTIPKPGIIIIAVFLLIGLIVILTFFSMNAKSSPSIISTGDGSSIIIPTTIMTSVPTTALTQNSSAIDISGQWTGILFQDNSPRFADQYTLYLNLIQNGNTITGTERYELANNYRVKDIQGTLSNNVFVYSNTRVIESEGFSSNPYGLNRFTLIVEGNKMTGVWAQIGAQSNYGRLIAFKK